MKQLYKLHSTKYHNKLFATKTNVQVTSARTSQFPLASYEVHGLLDRRLHELLDVPLLLVVQVVRRAAGATGTSPVTAGRER